MTQEQFIKEAKVLAERFAFLCYALNEGHSDGTAEKYGTVCRDGRSTIVAGEISFSMQQTEDDSLKRKVHPSTLEFRLGGFKSQEGFICHKFPVKAADKGPVKARFRRSMQSKWELTQLKNGEDISN